MPLSKTCSVEGMRKTVSALIREGRPASQAIAIGYDRLKKACHVETKKRLTPKEITAMKKNPYPLLIAALNPSRTPESFAGYRKGLDRFKESHGAAAEMKPIVVDIPGVEAGGTWVLQGHEESVIYRSDLVKNTSKGSNPYEHTVGDGASIPVLKLRYYSVDSPGVEMVVTINKATGKIIPSYKNGWMDESR